VGKNHIIRAALEAVAYQSEDLLAAMNADMQGVENANKIHSLRVDGGASANALLMQMQSDFSGIEVLRSANPEATAAGAAYLAGLAVDFFHSREELKNKLGAGEVYRPAIDEATRKARMQGWHRAIKACRIFSESEE
jgi:glycerol kinase